jgi:NAD(P)-dependent dehydrogenase (short-subunit alcohol dehydrogenase family)
MKLQGKVAVITGAGSGIGQSTAELFSREGAAVVVADIAPDAAEGVASAIRALDGRAHAVKCDVSSAEDAREAVRSAVEAFGGLDIVVNNAGIRPLNCPDVVGTSQEAWDRTFAVNVRGGFLISKYAVPELQKRGGGVILFNASATGLGGAAGYLPYGASKAALISMTKTMAVELAPSNVRVNSVSPGGVRTPLTTGAFETLGPEAEAVVAEAMRRMTPLGATMLDPRDIANAFLYLASDDSSRVTGHNLVVDGGWTAMLPRPN